MTATAATLAVNVDSELLQSVRAFYDSDRRVRLFDLFIGAVAARDDDRPILGKKCVGVSATDLLG